MQAFFPPRLTPNKPHKIEIIQSRGIITEMETSNILAFHDDRWKSVSHHRTFVLPAIENNEARERMRVSDEKPCQKVSGKAKLFRTLLSWNHRKRFDETLSNMSSLLFVTFT